MLPSASFFLPSLVRPCFISATPGCTRRDFPRSAASHYLADGDISARVYSTTVLVKLPQTPPLNLTWHEQQHLYFIQTLFNLLSSSLDPELKTTTNPSLLYKVRT
ncbi:hypothetical protein ASPBRDRAFT_46745 [Aspergillus brasiliensis CBS 101740]|uniref:Uncharacterized protein n=1 Tax=Aspergillus brasiliensis (strain CBS 101740 / IMI 381727 / IBT 21946) TaxID=767769 RepID=A0A1L9UA23_ASPBC|nr:hypothetical protein ASPBRDRAFT_46745 [Aspergillus brasiliensis CBS 101740]